MKIVFISPRPFGLMGTPGAYLLVESYAKSADVHIISNTNKNNAQIVYQPEGKTNHYELDFSDHRFLEKISSVVKKICPDIIIMGNYAKWFDIAAVLRPKCRDTAFVLDIKSPLIIDNNNSAFQKVKREGNKNMHLLDLVMTRCKEDVDTWIPGCQVQILEYPLGIKLQDYMPQKKDDAQIFCQKFVYIGAIHPRRELDRLIQYISMIPETLRNQLVFDFFGDGPAIKDLLSLVKKLGIEDIVHFKGCLDSRAVAAKLPEYDAGIAWVPHGLYEFAPSLKLMEYLAAGLVPLAMDTWAHKNYAEKGFHVQFFADSFDSFCNTIQDLFHKGIPVSHREENLKQITMHDWDVIATEKILPALTDLKDNIKNCVPARFAGISDNVLSWDLPFEPENTPKTSDSKIRIAGVVGDRVFHGLDMESEFLLLTPENWQSVIAHTHPDFVLFESTWFTATGHWYMAQTIPGEENDLLVNLLRYAREKNIPTVFWMTMNAAYCQHFTTLAKEFDYVFCADPQAVVSFAKDGIDADILLPAVQPTIFNPVIDTRQNKSLDTGLLYDGWVDLFRYPKLARTLKRFTKYDLNIYQTSLMMYKGQLQRTDPELAPFVRGTVSELLLPLLLKNAGMYLSFELSHKNKTEQTWSLLQAAASRIPVAHLGGFEDDQLNGIIRQFNDEDSFCDYVKQGMEKSLAAEKDKHLAWRQTFLNHVFEKRVQTICHEIGISLDKKEFPMATLVTGTMRPELLPKCFRQFEDQTYPNKELILIFNGDARAVKQYQSQYAGNDHITITSIPFDFTVGTVLNYGLLAARGEYFFRIDDDDTYGPNYVIDTLLYQKAVKSDIFGKRGSFFHFEGEKEIYLRNGLLPSVKSFSADQLHKNQEFVISGCGFAGTVPFLRKYRFPDNIQASVDTGLVDQIKASDPVKTCLLVDNMNMVVERALDIASQTWRIDADDIKRKSRVATTQFDDIVF
jgi:glycosyltransferase involved in cell wall biosynthesis